MTQTLSRPDGAPAGTDTNPLRAGVASNRITDPCNVVFFGASGDLVKRMLMPAMYNLRLGDIMPNNYGIIGFSRSEWHTDEFREEMHKAIDEFSRSGPAKEPLWSDFAKRVSFVPGSFEDPAAFAKLKEQLEKNDEELGTQGNRLFYLSTPPSVFSLIIDMLEQAGLGPKNNPKGWTRIIIEKPFGTDLDSARALQFEVEKVFDERQVYRIDHYLGKEPVQDIMALRFANVIFEPIWNRRYVDSVQITAAETVGVEGRGGYYENSGALRDMIQNHVMNLLALVAMEPPVSANADSIRDEKFKALSAIRPIPRERIMQDSARGQYDAGSIAGKPVPGYREEPSVNPQSNTDTYAALKLYIDNWRWADVPFYLRSGKRLAHKNSEIAIRFKGIPHRLFGELGDSIDNNVLVMKIQPEEGISLCGEGPRAEDAHPRGLDGLQLRDRLRRRLGAGVRTAHRRRDARRCDAVHALGRGRNRVEHRHAGPRALAEQLRRDVPELFRRLAGAAVVRSPVGRRGTRVAADLG